MSRMNTPDLVGACGYVEHDYPNLFLPDRLWRISFVKETNVKYFWYYLMAIAQRVYERHQVLTELLASFGVEHTVAEEDACRMEHVISQETFDVFRRMLK